MTETWRADRTLRAYFAKHGIPVSDKQMFTPGGVPIKRKCARATA